MNKKLSALVLSLVLILAFAISAFAVPQPPHSGEKSSERLYPLLVDDADLLSDESEATLLSKLEEISARQKMDVAVITVQTLGSRNVETYTDDFYDYFGYGQGESNDGVMLLISMEERQVHMTAVGKAIQIFTDAGRDYILDNYVMKSIGNEDYYDAFDSFASLCDDFITQAETGESYDVGNMPKGELTRVDDIWIIVALVAGVIVTAVVTANLKKQMKNVTFKAEANSYAVPGSLYITRSYDTFITSSTTTRVIERDTNSGDSGGSSTHSSSSGTSHSGSSRSF